MPLVRHIIVTCGRRTSASMESTDITEHLISMKDKIFRFARSILTDRCEAEDVTQDILEKFWKNRDSLGRYANSDAFIMTSVRNLCCDRLRGRKIRQDRHGDIKAVSATGFDGGFVPDNMDVVDVVERIMEELPEKQRMIMHLRDVECYEIDEIAEIVGMDSPSVRVLLSRARKSVKDKIIKTMNYGV